MFCKSFSRVFPRLLSLTVKELSKSIDDVELFLRMTPSLIYLRLIGNGEKVMNGKYWREIITTNLSQLNKFEFYFSRREYDGRTPADVELIISSFQTPFWLEQKKWFAIYECNTSLISTVITLHSISRKKSIFYYKPNSQKVFVSTNPMIMHNDRSRADNITILGFNLNKPLADEIEEKVCCAKKTLTLTQKEKKKMCLLLKERLCLCLIIFRRQLQIVHYFLKQQK